MLPDTALGDYFWGLTLSLPKYFFQAVKSGNGGVKNKNA